MLEQKPIMEDVEAMEEACQLGDPFSDKNPAIDHDEVLNELLKPYLKKKAETFSGYQANQQLDYSKHLAFGLDMHLNNIGDPYEEGGFRCSTKAVERNVISYFSKLWRAPRPGRIVVNPDLNSLPPEEIAQFLEEAWGYVLTMGSTEGNLYAIRNARDYLKGKYMNQWQAEPNTHRHVEHSLSHATFADADFSTKTVARKVKGRNGQQLTTIERAKAVNTEPVIFYSDVSHYSIGKIKDLLEIYTPDTLGNKIYPGQCPLPPTESGPAAWPAKVPSHIDGTTNLEALVKLVKFFADRLHPVIIVGNYGTTFTGVHDDMKKMHDALDKAGCLKTTTWTIRDDDDKSELGLNSTHRKSTRTITRDNHWIHVDGALGAFYGSLFNGQSDEIIAQTAQWLDLNPSEVPHLPAFDYGSEAGTKSIAMSGHKALGAPFPTGVVSTVRKNMLNFESVEYIGSADTTISGSRNGLSPLVLWSFLARNSAKQHAQVFMTGLENARYAAKKMASFFPTTEMNHYGGPIFHFTNSLSVIFPRPSQEKIEKYSLSLDMMRYGVAPKMDMPVAHIFCMEHLTREKIDELLDDIKDEIVESYGNYLQKSGLTSQKLEPVYSDELEVLPLPDYMNKHSSMPAAKAQKRDRHLAPASGREARRV